MSDSEEVSDRQLYIKKELEAADILYYNLSNYGIIELFDVLLWPLANSLPTDVKDDSIQDSSNREEPIQEISQLQEEEQTRALDLSTRVFSNRRESIQEVPQLEEKKQTLPSIRTKIRYDPPFYCYSEFSNLSLKAKVKQLVKYHMMLKAEKEYYKRISNRRVRCGNPIRPSRIANGNKENTRINKIKNIESNKPNKSPSDQPQMPERQGSSLLNDALNYSLTVSNINTPSTSYVEPAIDVSVTNINTTPTALTAYQDCIMKAYHLPSSPIKNAQSDKPNEPPSGRMEMPERQGCSLLNDIFSSAVLNTEAPSSALNDLIERRIGGPSSSAKQSINATNLLPHCSSKNSESTRPNEFSIPERQGSSLLNDALSSTVVNIQGLSSALNDLIESKIDGPSSSVKQSINATNEPSIPETRGSNILNGSFTALNLNPPSSDLSELIDWRMDAQSSPVKRSFHTANLLPKKKEETGKRRKRWLEAPTEPQPSGSGRPSAGGRSTANQMIIREMCPKCYSFVYDLPNAAHACIPKD